MTKQENREIRKFKMHPDLLFSVIQAQAGTPEKALLEAVMNAVDAGATFCEIQITESGFIIKDDGKGFASQQEIDDFFETFGTPHKEGDATYGRFRMGRGQLFAFSSSIWRTGSFEMTVDIKTSGLDYIFKKDLSTVRGCTITGTWYEILTTSALFNISKELEKLIKYMQIPVTLNGEKITCDVDSVKWDYKEEDFYIKISSSGTTLSVYNMGALVTHYPASRFGVSGTVVTKSALKVNFARNDVLVTLCPLWKKISKKLNEVMGVETAKKTVLTEAEREAWVASLLTKTRPLHECMGKALLQDVSSKKISISYLLNAKKIAFSSGDYRSRKKEEKINDSKAALVLSRSVLDQFNVSNATDFVKKINEIILFSNEAVDKELSIKWAVSWYNKRVSSFAPAVLAIEDLIKNISGQSSVKEKLNKKDKVFLGALEAAANILVSHASYKKLDFRTNTFSELKNKFARKLMIGTSEVALAWTDGNSYIVVNESLKNKGPLKVVTVLLHEYCHKSSSADVHDHSAEFYEEFHDWMTHDAEVVYSAVDAYIRAFNKLCLKEKIKPSGALDKKIVSADTYSAINESFQNTEEV